MHATTTTQEASDSASATDTRGAVRGEAALLYPTLLELAFRAVRDDAPAASAAELSAKQRLRMTLLDAAVAQFTGHSDGLQRHISNDELLRLGAPSDGADVWRVAHIDRQGVARVIQIHSSEDAAIRALIVAAGESSFSGASL